MAVVWSDMCLEEVIMDVVWFLEMSGDGCGRVWYVSGSEC